MVLHLIIGDTQDTNAICGQDDIALMVILRLLIVY